MAPANAFPKKTNSHQNIELSKTRTAPRESFSRASHFAFVLVPVFLGAGYANIKEYFFHQKSLPFALFTHSMRAALEQDQSFWFNFLVFGMFVLGLGSALSLLKLMERLEDWEAENKKNSDRNVIS